MNNQSIVVEEINRKNTAENFSRAGVKAMGVCMALTSNEHPIIRLNGVVLAVYPKHRTALIPLAIALAGWILAKDKKKAFIQRAFCFGSTVSIAGSIAYDPLKTSMEMKYGQQTFCPSDKPTIYS